MSSHSAPDYLITDYLDDEIRDPIEMLGRYGNTTLIAPPLLLGCAHTAPAARKAGGHLTLPSRRARCHSVMSDWFIAINFPLQFPYMADDM